MHKNVEEPKIKREIYGGWGSEGSSWEGYDNVFSAGAGEDGGGVKLNLGALGVSAGGGEDSGGLGIGISGGDD